MLSTEQNPYRRTDEELRRLLSGKDVDILDVRILSLLQIDGRASFNAIADKLGISVATVSARVRKLQESGVLKGFSAIVSCEGLGFTENLWLMVYLDPESDATEVGNRIAGLRGVKCVYSVFGEFDLLAHLCCATSEDIDNALSAIGRIEGVRRVAKLGVHRKIKEDFRVQI
ncbi:MAG: Lrp/AsnC family transcriptional regulator [Candidatus Thorarchaeota archaeon]